MATATQGARGTAMAMAMASEPDGAADLSGRIRVALVDDHPTLLMGVSALFASDPRFTIVGTGLSATAAIDLVEAHEPDVVTLDLSMPGDVFTAIRSIVDTSPGTRVLIFTAYADVDLALRALDAGAHGFVLAGSLQLDIHGLDQRVAHGVEARRPVEREGEHAALQGGQNGCFFHAPPRLAWRAGAAPSGRVAWRHALPYVRKGWPRS